MSTTTTTQTSALTEGISLQGAHPTRKDVTAELHFHKDNEDGSPPAPTYVDNPKSYYRPVETHNVTIGDIRGREDEFSIDKQGFQIYPHVSQEKDFLDEEHIKSVYYPETEQLLKDA